MNSFDPPLSRRTLLWRGALGAAGLSIAGLYPDWAQSGTAGLARAADEHVGGWALLAGLRAWF